MSIHEANFIGRAFACAAHGIDPSEIETVKSASEALSNTDFHAKIAGLAEAMFVAGGLEADPVRFMYGAMSKKAALNSEELEYVGLVSDTLAELNKEAGEFMDSVPQMVAAGGMAGAAGGALLWGLGRDTEETSEGNLKQEVARNIYARAAAEIKAKAQRRRQRLLAAG